MQRCFLHPVYMHVAWNPLPSKMDNDFSYTHGMFKDEGMQMKYKLPFCLSIVAGVIGSWALNVEAQEVVPIQT